MCTTKERHTHFFLVVEPIRLGYLFWPSYFLSFVLGFFLSGWGGFPPPLLSGSTSLKKMACHSYGKGLYLHTWGVCRMPRRTPGRCWSCCRCPRTRRTWTPRTAATRGCRSDEASTQNSCLDNNVKKMYHMKILKNGKKYKHSWQKLWDIDREIQVVLKI